MPQKHNIKDIKVAVEKGMKEKSRQFVESGNKLYIKIIISAML